MQTKEIKKMNFVGRPFMPAMMDENKSFTGANQELEQNQDFQKFIKDNHLSQRASMVVFGPENFMYWYGVLVDPDVAVPQSLMKFTLPSAKIAQEEVPGNLSQFSMPLNYILPEFFQKLAEAGVKVYENPGDSNTPYFIQKYDSDDQKVKKIWYIESK